MPKSRKVEIPGTGSPVLDAWALASHLQSQGVAVFAELNKANGTTEVHNVDPTAPVSEVGLPLIPRRWISDLAPEKVSDLFYNWVLSTAGRDGADWDLTCLRLHAMPQQWRLIYTICWLETEVDNGGFDQFFYNGKGDFDAATENDLLCIGAKDLHDLFLAARRIYYSTEQDRDELIPELESLTDEFYAQSNTPYHIVGAYIIANQNIYCCD
jgi:hypothetical protein